MGGASILASWRNRGWQFVMGKQWEQYEPPATVLLVVVIVVIIIIIIIIIIV